jgi:GTP cyclohydrolase IA
MGTVKTIKPVRNEAQRPSREEAEKAVETILRWIGEDPAREGLRETPARVIRAYDEFFAGYEEDPSELLNRTFEDIDRYDDFVLVKNIDFVSHCEHHIVPIVGRAHVAYWPQDRVVGLSKLARVVDVYARRLVSQETMTRQILETIDKTLAPKGTAVLIDAVHHCMSSRGAMKTDSSTVTSQFSGIFQHDEKVRDRFLSYCPRS